ncbi:hypothetical protein J4E82_010090 [Alternaria postmessia]|uniref:uncharacterized protein n=1 Tax=Alternaria postmessia TaxID=1187938 RepID=UPI002223EECD|nr:uncharacterized protein J4E82_010090 [Alternaria postmessia]KAI5369097.1 hypothetical protein J4E82_010090 [Alternaria postmessia]
MLDLESFGLSSLFSVEGKVCRSQRRATATEILRLLPGDVGSKQRVDELVNGLQKLEDHIDVLINCAGINRPWKAEASEFDGRHNDPDAVEKLLWHGLDDENFQSTYSINVNGVYFMSTRMVPLLRKSPAPTVIVIASIAGMMLQRWSIVVSDIQSEFVCLPVGSTLMIRLRHCTVQVYSPRDSHRKSFILVIEASWTDGSLNSFKIRVNTILPGIFPSEMTGVSAKPDLSDLIESNPQAAKAVARCPAGRAGAETEIVGPCLFLASAAGGYMNNARITVDGGRLMAAGSNDGVRMEDWTYV